MQRLRGNCLLVWLSVPPGDAEQEDADHEVGGDARARLWQLPRAAKREERRDETQRETEAAQVRRAPGSPPTDEADAAHGVVSDQEQRRSTRRDGLLQLQVAPEEGKRAQADACGPARDLAVRARGVERGGPGQGNRERGGRFQRRERKGCVRG